MLAEVKPTRDDLVSPIFVRPGQGERREISSMPGQFQYSPDQALDTVKRMADKGIRAVLLFGVVEEKDPAGSLAWSADGPVQILTGLIKKAIPEMLVMADTCLCEYTSHGHCGPLGLAVLPGQQDVDNDAALSLLARTALSHARAGADIVAPSAMMDGQVGAIRETLDSEGYLRVCIMSYAVKLASSMYGPFRDAAGSKPICGERKTYQMDYRSARQARLEAAADTAQGADILMVKPAATYLDVLADIRRRSDLPIGAYHVSGEYAQIKAAAARGWLDERAAALEITSAIKRAGADIIITYFAEDLAGWLG
jgi:porphobilinogen synthase